MKLVERPFSPIEAFGLIRQGCPPVLARALSSRGVKTMPREQLALQDILPYSALKGAAEMASLLADAVVTQKRLLIVADYDADGATACSVGVRALRAFGANVGYLIPNRIEHGYGLTPDIVDIACHLDPKPDYLITVDNGIASHAGIDLANKLGVPVLVTDHHLPTDMPPAAKCIVNPSQHGCEFPSKAMAGCGVIFYVMWALQDELMDRGYAKMDPYFAIEQLLPIVAIGTIADVVALDENNRSLVSMGLKLIRDGYSFPGIDALAAVADKDPRRLTTSDIGFGLGPRINAAGRLESMDAGVECLTTSSVARAKALAKLLNEINARRKEIEGNIVEEAVRRLITEADPNKVTLVLHSEGWHQGVIGIVASRLKDRLWRPTFVLASGKEGELKGSGRSIPGLHLRDALDMVDKRRPGVLLKFGGHAMAAGMTVAADRFQDFCDEFEKVCKELISPAALNQTLEVDGGLDTADMTLESVKAIKNQVWGQGFLEPVFVNTFGVKEARAIGGGNHLRLVLEKDGRNFVAVKFRHEGPAPQGHVTLAYKLESNTYKDETSVQLLVDHIEQP